MGGERRTNSSVSRESTRTTTRQCNDQDAKAAPCMCLMHADGDKQRGSTNFWSFVVLQLCLYQTVWFAASLMEPKCCSVSVGVRGCVARAIPAKPAQCLPCSRSQTSVQRLLKTKDPANRVLGVSRGVKLLTSFPARVCGRRPLRQVRKWMACICVSLARRHGKRGPLSTLHTVGCSVWHSFQPRSLDVSCAHEPSREPQRGPS